MSIKILLDSASDHIPEIKEKLEILPMTIRFGDTEYLDGVTISHEEFYNRLIESDDLPTTSLISPDAFSQKFKELTDNGDQVLVITVSSKLSGTYQSAVIAAEDYPGKVYVLDSLNVALSIGILAEYALELIDKGMAIEEIYNHLLHIRSDIRIIAMLDTLEYLKRGGRISKSVAFAGSLLSIKPVIHIKDGEIGILGKARGSRQANNLLIREIGANGIDFNKPILLGYTGISDALLKKYIEDSASLWEDQVDTLRCTTIGSAIGTHAGPGAIAVAFFKKDK